MKKISILWLLINIFTVSLSAQTVEQQARRLYANKEYEQAAPGFKKLLKSQPNSGNYNFWYGVCCFEMKQYPEAIKHLKIAVKRRVPSGQLYLAQAYNNNYQYEEAIQCYEEYIEALKKRKRSVEKAEQLLEKSKTDLRRLKGVEKVCVIDSFVVDKANFLKSYKLSEESGKLYAHNDFFKTEGEEVGTVYKTEIGNKIYYTETDEKGILNIFSKNRLSEEWSSGSSLPGSINAAGNTNYPFVLSDGITIYYACDSDESMGGYDIFVTRYNTNTNTYLMPQNVGMPFNSPYNDYMYAIDEYNNLGWFASDRYQPEGKVCIYVFIPNSSKQTYNYESMPTEQIISLAKLNSIKDSQRDSIEVNQAIERLETAIEYQPKESEVVDFSFVIDDQRTYHQLSDFKTEEAKKLFVTYQRMKRDFDEQQRKLKNQRKVYASSSDAKKKKLSPAILDTEKRANQMAIELYEQIKKVRKVEIK